LERRGEYEDSVILDRDRWSNTNISPTIGPLLLAPQNQIEEKSFEKEPRELSSLLGGYRRN
jgi:hypothetical protein